MEESNLLAITIFARGANKRTLTFIATECLIYTNTAAEVLITLCQHIARLSELSTLILHQHFWESNPQVRVIETRFTMFNAPSIIGANNIIIADIVSTSADSHRLMQIYERSVVSFVQGMSLTAIVARHM